MFVDREFELDWLEEGWTSGKAQLRILYGRRRRAERTRGAGRQVGRCQSTYRGSEHRRPEISGVGTLELMRAERFLGPCRRLT